MPRYTGKNGAVYIKVGVSFVWVSDVYDWEFDLHTTLLPCDIKGDVAERFIPSHASGLRFTAKRYNVGTQTFPGFVNSSAANAEQTTWRLDLIKNDNSVTQIELYGYAISSSTSAPRGMSEETFELQVDGSAPSYIYSM